MSAAPRRTLHGSDPELTPLEQALVKALVATLVKELRREEGDEREREHPGGQAEALREPQESANERPDNNARPLERQATTTP